MVVGLDLVLSDGLDDAESDACSLMALSSWLASDPLDGCVARYLLVAIARGFIDRIRFVDGDSGGVRSPKALLGICRELLAIACDERRNDAYREAPRSH